MTDNGGNMRTYGNRYEIDSKIARGGMADVFLAKDKLLDRPVALKVLFPELSVDPSFVERFRREAQNAARLSHPNIVSVYDWGEDDNTYYIVMEMVEGKSLSAMLRDEKTIAPERAAEIGAETASALSFAHRNGVVHRDVKPGNILIDQSGMVKVTDFGIARARNTTENLTQTGAVMGTATYFSPEQAQGLAVDQRSDVYSLGVVLYEMVAGKPPFSGDNPVTIAYKHVRESPEALTSINPSIPADYQSIVGQALTKAPPNRYATAEDLRADLVRFRRNQPVTATTTAVGGPMADDATQAVPTATAMQNATRAYGDATRAAPAPAKKSGRKMAGPIFTLLGLLAAIALVIYLVAFGFGGGAQVTVPNVVGQNVEQARTALTDAGLRTRVQNQANSAEAGTVLSQDPGANESVGDNTRVTLTVSTGRAATESVRVPDDLVGSTAANASSRLRAAGLTPSTTSRESDQPEGTVISTSPGSGASVDRGSSVQVFVSSGRTTTTQRATTTTQRPSTTTAAPTTTTTTASPENGSPDQP